MSKMIEACATGNTLMVLLDFLCSPHEPSSTKFEEYACSLQQRIGFEAKALETENRYCPAHTPTLYLYDPRMALIVMQYLALPHVILRLVSFVCLAISARTFLAF